MLNQEKDSKHYGPTESLAKVVPVLIITLLAGAIIFFRERMLFIDAPHVFFRIVNDGRLHIEEHRIGSFITQMVPLIGSWLHLPFRLLLILYSASFYLFYLGVALLLVYRFKNYGLAILFGLYLTLFVSDTYYWPNNEVHQGMAWLFLAFSITFYPRARSLPLPLYVLLFIASFYFAIWTHPLIILVAVYLWFFFQIDKRFWPFSKTESLAYTALLLLLSVLKYYQGSTHGYDSSKIDLVKHFHPAVLAQAFSFPMLHFFFERCVTNYWLFPILFVFGIAALIRQRKYTLAAWTVFFFTAFLILIGITFPDLSTQGFYIESEYMPLAVIACAPFVYYVLPKISPRQGAMLLAVLFSIRLGYICYAATPFAKRLTAMNHISARMQAKGLTKLVITEPSPYADSALIMNWGAPVESIFISKLKGEMPQRTFIFLPANMLWYANAGKDTLLGCWEKRTFSSLNTNYFQFDTTTPYTVMDYETLMQ